LISRFLISGFGTGVTFEQDYLNLTERPLFIDDLIATSLFKPSSVKCSLRIINKKACLNKM
jgi:hypothetical protein